MKTGSFVRIFQADFELLFLLIIELKLFSNIPRNVFVSFMYKSKVSGMSAELISSRQLKKIMTIQHTEQSIYLKIIRSPPPTLLNPPTSILGF